MKDISVISNHRWLDERGIFLKVYNQKNFDEMGIQFIPQETFISVSKKNVVRGIHFQNPPFAHDKLISCIKGRVLDVIVDLRKSSPDYGQVLSLELNEENAKTVFIPKGFGHGFMALTDDTILLYEVSEGYNPEFDKGIHPLSIDFNWPAQELIISERDQSHESFKSFKSEF